MFFVIFLRAKRIRVYNENYILDTFGRFYDLGSGRRLSIGLSLGTGLMH